ncbi:hypothetical protein CK203_028910 [Vitis vinifera]|uniref:Uncharacterized protein n=1 Tax=Vitis vinifera TaxID=29760 RepID=A0A438IAJ2_VITVI|nr:hypothetical protein CK203_028910 [Vitis vinifera]
MGLLMLKATTQKGRFQLLMLPDENVVLDTFNLEIAAILVNGADSTRDCYYRAALNFDGVFRIYTRPKVQSNGSWVQSWYVSKDICSEIQGDLGVVAVAFNSYCIPDSNGRPTFEWEGGQECIPGKTSIEVPKHGNSSGELPLQITKREKKDQGTLISVESILLVSSEFLNFLLAAAISLLRSHPSQ